MVRPGGKQDVLTQPGFRSPRQNTLMPSQQPNDEIVLSFLKQALSTRHTGDAALNKSVTALPIALASDQIRDHFLAQNFSSRKTPHDKGF